MRATLILLSVLFAAVAAPCHADEITDIPTLDSSTIDKAGDFHFAYSIPGGCSKHTSHVLIDLKTEQNDGINSVVAARIRVQDSLAKPDPCAATGITTVEGSADLQDLLQKTADAQGAVIGERRILFTLPDTNVFTGK